MNCYIHPDREAEWTCSACGQPICPECKVSLQGKVYCNPCVEKMYQTAVNRKQVSWFEQHLNLTLMLAFFLSEMLATAIMIMVSPFTDAGLPEDAIFTPSWFISSAAAYFILFPVANWVIRKKARNRWNIFWLLMPFGIIMILLLTNMSNPPTDNNSKSPQMM